MSLQMRLMTCSLDASTQLSSAWNIQTPERVPIQNKHPHFQCRPAAGINQSNLNRCAHKASTSELELPQQSCTPVAAGERILRFILAAIKLLHFKNHNGDAARCRQGG
jgi:hypothetical protein